MHDPSVVVFDLHIPVPQLGHSFLRAPKWGARRRRYTGGDLVGKPMHRLLRPAGWEVHAFDREVRLYNIATVWHEEPGGQDSGTVCKGMGGTELTAHNVRWAWKHRAHLDVRWHVLGKARRWLNVRCAHCGRRLGYKEAAFGDGWYSEKTYHRPCLDLVGLQRWEQILLQYAAGTADASARWQVEHRLKEMENETERKQNNV